MYRVIFSYVPLTTNMIIYYISDIKFVLISFEKQLNTLIKDIEEVKDDYK